MSLTGGDAKSLMFKSRTQVSRTATLATVDEEDTAAIAVRDRRSWVAGTGTLSSPYVRWTSLVGRR